MREVLVIRHASTRLNNDDAAIDRLRGWSDIPLSLQGMEQAKTLADEVAQAPSRCHPMQRSKPLRCDGQNHL